jgi:hypothetical protein
MASDGKMYRVPLEGAPLGSEQSALDLMGEAYGTGAEVFLIPVKRLNPEFFRLASGLAGGFVQKLQNYGYRVYVLGDISQYVAHSEPLAAFVRETNRVGRHRFVGEEGQLDKPA